MRSSHQGSLRRSPCLFALLATAACGQSASETPPHEPLASSASAPTSPVPSHGGGDELLPEGYVRVPNGISAHGDCVHELPNGASVEANGDVVLDGRRVDHFDACVHPMQVASRHFSSPELTGRVVMSPAQPHNWIEDTTQTAQVGQQFAYLDETFVVPSEPAIPQDTGGGSPGQLVYFFPSVQVAPAGGGIVQPVLQWGGHSHGAAMAGGVGGSNGDIGTWAGWTYSAWGVDRTGAYHTPGIRVSPGHTLRATMALIQQDSKGATWWVVATDVTTGAQDGELVHFATTALWNISDAAVLEAYGIQSCDDFPAAGIAIFNYPTIAFSTFGAPWGSTPAFATDSYAWTPRWYGDHSLQSDYAGPACSAFGPPVSRLEVPVPRSRTDRTGFSVDPNSHSSPCVVGWARPAPIKLARNNIYPESPAVG